MTPTNPPLLRRAFDVVTPLGWFVIASTVVTGVLAITYRWVEAGVIGVIGVILIVGSLPFLVGARSYIVRLGVDKRRVTAGKPIVVSLFVRNHGFRSTLPARGELPVGAEIQELAIPFIRPTHRVRIDRDIRTTRRGVITIGPLTLTRRDPLGLFHREITWADWHTIHVHPPWIGLPPITAGATHDLEGVASAQLTVSDLSFHALREYTHGDSLRHVHWKSTARTGTLMVRQYEESQAARSAVLFDSNIDQYSSRDEFELGVSACASLAVQAIDNGRERVVASGWPTQAGPRPINGLAHLPSHTAGQLLDALSELNPTHAAPNVEDLATTLLRTTPDLSVVTIVTGALTTFSALRQAATMFPPSVRVQILRCRTEAEPRVRMVSNALFYDIGFLSDLPAVLVQGASR